MMRVWLAPVFRFHRTLSWLGGVALLCWVLSGLLHPLLTWTGPRAAQFFPPRMALDEQHLVQAGQALSAWQGLSAGFVRLVPFGDEVLLQLTGDPDQPRRYRELASGQERAGHDQQQAIWLARYYTGLADTPVAEVHWQTDFDDDYPWVNRLLPVYRVRFATDDRLTAYVHTEFGALAGLTNDYKNRLQRGFRWLHTWSWLDGVEGARVLVMGLLLASAIATLLAGMMLLRLLRQRPIASAARRWHRLLAWVVAVPLLGFTTSGFYHLLHHAGGETRQAIRLPAPMPLPEAPVFARPSSLPANAVFQSASLVQAGSGRWLWRVAVSVPDTSLPTDSQRYRGVSSEQRALLLDAVTGEDAGWQEADLARQLAGRLRPDLDGVPVTLAQVTQFSHHYDFRNKRLPVWQLQYQDADRTTLYLDTAAGLEVDSSQGRDHRERLAFSVLHKWNPLTPLMGRAGRDLLVVGCLLLVVALTVLGYRRLLRRS